MGRLREEGVDELGASFFQVRGRADSRGESFKSGPLLVQGPAREHEVPGESGGELVEEKGDAAPYQRHPEIHLRERDVGPGSDDSEIACCGQEKAPPEGVALDGGDREGGEVSQLFDHTMARVREIADEVFGEPLPDCSCAHVVEIESRAEVHASAREAADSDAGVASDDAESLGELLEQVRTQRVAGSGALELDRGETVPMSEFEMFKAMHSHDVTGFRASCPFQMALVSVPPASWVLFSRAMREGAKTGRRLWKIEVFLGVLAAFLVIAPGAVVYWVTCLLLLPWRTARIRVGNFYGKICGRMVLFACRIRPVIFQHERIGQQPAVYVCNHSSTIDMWVGMWLCPFGGCGVGKKEIIKVPFFGLAFILSGHLVLDRSNIERSIASMEKMRTLIHAHELSLWIWPEGTRSLDGVLSEFKKGFAHLAIQTGLPVVPVVFHEADRLWRGRTMAITQGDLYIDVLDAIDTSAWSVESLEEHVDSVREVFRANLSERQRGEPWRPQA